MPANLKELEDRLWDAADQLRANSHLNSKVRQIAKDLIDTVKAEYIVLE